MSKCDKCGSDITLVDKVISKKRGANFCSICLHQDSLKRKREAEAKELVVKADRLEIDGVDMAEYWCDARIKGMAGVVHSKENVLKSDPINHPEHYTSHPSGIECIEVTRHMSFAAGNVIKYLWRNGLKDGEPSLKDLKKARWYLDDMIYQLENGDD